MFFLNLFESFQSSDSVTQVTLYNPVISLKASENKSDIKEVSPSSLFCCPDNFTSTEAQASKQRVVVERDEEGGCEKGEKSDLKGKL